MLIVENLSKTYANGVRALQGISLELSPGEARKLAEEILARNPNDAAARLVTEALDARGS